MSNRLYVENLPPSANEGNVRELFTTVGTVIEVKLVVDAATGVSRGRAFVTMATPEMAEAALNALHSHSLGGRNIAVTMARQKEESPAGLIGHGFESGMSNTHGATLKNVGSKKKPHPYRPRRKRKTRVTNTK